MAVPFTPNVEKWVPAVVVKVAARLHVAFDKNFEGGPLIISRLISDVRMKNVWQLLYSKKRKRHEPTSLFVYPAQLELQAASFRREANELRKRGGEANLAKADALDARAETDETEFESPAQIELWAQDIAVSELFRHACCEAVDISPVYLPSLKAKDAKISAVIAALHQQREVLEEIEWCGEADAVYDLIKELADRRELIQEEIDENPSIISRNRGDPTLRSYVIALHPWMLRYFGTPLYGTLATIANVAFECEVVTGSMVRDWVRCGLLG
jgi:hypothetical protein